MEQKRHEEALQAISHAIHLAPQGVNAIFNRAQLLFSMERYEDALADLERVFELTGGRGNNARWLQARALQRLGRDDGAIEALDLGIADAPSWAEAHRRKAQLMFEIGRMDEMRAAAARAVEVAPGESASHVLVALSRLFPEPRCGQARGDLARALELGADDPETARYIADVHATVLHAHCPDMYDGDLALRLAQTAVEENPEDADRQSTLGMVLYRHSRLREARDALARAVEVAVPRPRPDTLFFLAMAEQRSNRPTEARARYDQAVRQTGALAWQHNPVNRLIQDEAAELLGIQQ